MHRSVNRVQTSCTLTYSKMSLRNSEITDCLRFDGVTLRWKQAQRREEVIHVVQNHSLGNVVPGRGPEKIPGHTGSSMETEGQLQQCKRPFGWVHIRLNIYIYILHVNLDLRRGWVPARTGVN